MDCRESLPECDGGEGPVFWADLGGLGEVDLAVVAPVFEVWLRCGFALPPDPQPDGCGDGLDGFLQRDGGPSTAPPTTQGT